MTLEEAIKRLKSDIYKYSDFTENPNENEFWTAFDMAIKTLEQESCEDAISRRAAIVALDDRMSNLENVDMQIAMGFAKGIIHDLPSVNPQEPKTGHWIDRFPAKECKCSVCDFLICISNGSYIDMVGQMKYCPNCGAKMAESEVQT